VQGYGIEPVPFIVPDEPSRRAVIKPGERSESLNWQGITFLAVFNADSLTKLCQIGFGAHNEIVGGNYMMIRRSNNSTNCYVCDSNNNSIVGSGQC
jgi:hypothetical protein